MHPFALALALTAAPASAPDAGTVHGVDLAGMDRAVAPGDDFNAYVSGSWFKANVIPPDLSSYGVSTILAEEARKHTAELIKDASKGTSPEARQVGDCYDTFMDEATIESKGLKPLTPELTAIAAIKDKKGLATALGKTLRADTDALNNTVFHTEHLFGLWVVQALDDPKHNAPYLMQGGIDMPDREYYVSTSPDMVELRTKFLAHVVTMMKLGGLAHADTRAVTVVALLTKLAQAHVSHLDSEDIKQVVDWKREALAKNAP